MLRSLLLQVIEVDHSAGAAIDEARVVSEPVDAVDLARVALQALVGRAVERVEIVDVRVDFPTDCEHVTTVAEAHLFAVFERDVLVFVYPVGQHVEEEEFVTHAGQDVETAGVESHVRGDLTWGKRMRHEEPLLTIVPQHDAGGGASDDELLAQADIHAYDRFVVERTEQVLARPVLSALLLQVTLHELVAAIDEDQSVF